MNRKRAIVAVAIVALLFATSLLAYPASVGPEKAERLAKEFVLKRMTGPSGGILTSGKVRRIPFFPLLDHARLRESGVLSESTGLVMTYAVWSGDKALFDQQWTLAKTKMLGQVGLFHWKISAGGDLVSSASASVDDLRIVGAALDAYATWGDADYRDFALDIAENIKQYEVVDDVLRDFANWRDYGDATPASSLQLSYADTVTLKKLTRIDSSWQPILEKTGQVLLNGRCETGLFFEKLDFDTNTYAGERQNVINQLYCAIFAAEIEDEGHPFAKWMKTEFEDNQKLYAQYDCKTGEATLFFESAAAYALAVRYALKIGEHDLGERLIRRMLQFQNLNPLSRMYGGFFDDEVYSFDNLEAILALREYNVSRQR